MRQPSLLNLLTVAFAALLLVGAMPARGQTTERDRAQAVRAGMVINFIRYTKWPETAFADEKSPIVLALIGDDDIDRALFAAVRNETVGGRPIEFRRLRYPAVRWGETEPPAEELQQFYEHLRASHVAYFGDSEHDRVDAILENLRSQSTLTISDIPRFAERGGMLGFTIRERHIAFNANVDAINASKLRVSSQVLNLARIVRGPERPEGSP